METQLLSVAQFACCTGVSATTIYRKTQKGLIPSVSVAGQVRSSSTDDIACWFIDTNYNEESFFVRHAYFTGTDKPMERLEKALRTQVDSEVWDSIYGTVSRPFPKPKTNKIALKVINHYGDEVLKVFDVK